MGKSRQRDWLAVKSAANIGEAEKGRTIIYAVSGLSHSSLGKLRKESRTGLTQGNR